MPKIRKSEVITKLVDVPKPAPKHFWPREMKILNRLLKEWPIEFLASLSLPKKVPSLAVIANKSYAPKLKEKHDIYSCKIVLDIDREEGYNVKEVRVAGNPTAKPKKTLRDFLDE